MIRDNTGLDLRVPVAVVLRGKAKQDHAEANKQRREDEEWPPGEPEMRVNSILSKVRQGV